MNKKIYIYTTLFLSSLIIIKFIIFACNEQELNVNFCSIGPKIIFINKVKEINENQDNFIYVSDSLSKNISGVKLNCKNNNYKLVFMDRIWIESKETRGLNENVALETFREVIILYVDTINNVDLLNIEKICSRYADSLIMKGY